MAIQLDVSNFNTSVSFPCCYRCEYDSLTVVAPGKNDESDVTKVMCGDYNDRLKLLRFLSVTPMMFFWFKSDHSKALSGILASYSILQGGLYITCHMQSCPDKLNHELSSTIRGFDKEI